MWNPPSIFCRIVVLPHVLGFPLPLANPFLIHMSSLFFIGGTSLASSLNHQNFELCLMEWWHLWGERNDMLWKGTVEKHDALMARARSWWLNFQKALKVDHPSRAQALASA
ncbi:hypothetical protein PS2_000573 [Malus domestica]